MPSDSTDAVLDALAVRPVAIGGGAPFVRYAAVGAGAG
jgi:hypothetical protein